MGDPFRWPRGPPGHTPCRSGGDLRWVPVRATCTCAAGTASAEQGRGTERPISLISSVGLVFFCERHCPRSYLATRKVFFPFTSHRWHLYLLPATPSQGDITSSFENRDHTRPVLHVCLPWSFNRTPPFLLLFFKRVWPHSSIPILLACAGGQVPAAAGRWAADGPCYQMASPEFMAKVNFKCPPSYRSLKLAQCPCHC